jgi:hypothetical protein
MSESFHVKFIFSGFIVLKNKIFTWPHPILYIFAIISPLKMIWPFIWTNLTQRYYVPSLIDFGWRSQKCKRQQTDRWTDGQQVIIKADLSFQLRWAKSETAPHSHTVLRNWIMVRLYPFRRRVNLFITYFPWYQCDNTHVINFCYHIVYSYATPFEE